MIDCFKGILMTHDLDIFESGKNLGLNGLSVFLKLITYICIGVLHVYIYIQIIYIIYINIFNK